MLESQFIVCNAYYSRPLIASAVGLGKVCRCAPVFNFLRRLLLGDTTIFLLPEGDRINRSRRNLARKRIPWVCMYVSFGQGRWTLAVTMVMRTAP